MFYYYTCESNHQGCSRDTEPAPCSTCYSFTAEVERRGEERRGEESAQLVVFSMLPVSSLLFLEILSTGLQTAPGTTTPTSQLTKVQSLESS